MRSSRRAGRCGVVAVVMAADMVGKRGGGRPSGFTQAKADAICARLADGESLRSICRDESMPGTTAVCTWLAKYPEFAAQYARARELQADALFDEILDVADDGRNDWMERLGDDGEAAGWQANGDAIQRSKLRVDARKWMAARLAPKKYGDKQALEVSGKDGAPLIPVINVRIGDA